MTDDKKIILNYGKTFRKKRSEKLIDLDDNINQPFDFQIHKIEHLVKEFKDYMPPNRMSHYFLGLVSEGSGEKSIGQFTFKVQPNTAMIIPLCGIHSSRNWTLKNKGYVLSFNDKLFLESNFPKVFLNLTSLFKYSQIPYRVISTGESRKLSAVFEEIITEHKNYMIMKKEMICLKIAELVIMYNRIFSKNVNIEGINLTNNLYDKFIDLLESDFRKEKSVKYYANELATHPNHLNSTAKKQSGFTAKENIQNRLLLEAKYLLASSTLSIKEIAFELGFEDQNYFSHFFKESEKISPGEYRQKPL